MKQSILFTVISFAIAAACGTCLYFCKMPVVNFFATVVLCLAFTTFLIGCSLVWSRLTKKKVSNRIDTYLGCVALLVAGVAIGSMVFLTVNNMSLFVALIAGFSGIILLISGEIKRMWKRKRMLKKRTMAKPIAITHSKEFMIDNIRKSRKVSQAEFKRIMQFCKENNLGHLTVSQAIIAWDDYCEFVTP